MKRNKNALITSSNHLVATLPIEDLKPNPRNARTHPRRQIRQIKSSIKRFGFTNPILIDENNVIIAGHGRVEAAKKLGLESIPAIRLDHLTPDEIRAYVIADNKLALNAGWDEETLAIELQHLIGADIAYDVEITGFETAEIDFLIEGQAAHVEDSSDEIVPSAEISQPAVSRAGDVWQLGEHRLLCADARKASSYDLLLGGEHAELVFTDPPYNVPIERNVCGLGSVHHREFAMACGEMSRQEYEAFLNQVFRLLAKHSIDGSIHFICMDWRHMGEILAAGCDAYSNLKNLCVWAKTNAGMGSFYRSQHELVFVFKSGSAKHINNFELGQHGRHRSNVWSYAGANTLGPERLDSLAMHPTVKPVAMVADAIRDCSRRGDLVLDPFAGSGTTLIAAEKTGRCARLIEIDPHYVDVAIRRYQKVSGETAVHAETQQSFRNVESQRATPTTGREVVSHG